MKYAVTSQEMRVCDRNTSQYFGIDPMTLMERASLEVVHEIENWKEQKDLRRRLRVLVLAGVGNNGGDGVCIGRILKTRGYLVNICVMGDYTKAGDQLLSQLKIAEKYGINTDTFSYIRDNKCGFDFDIIVDSLFGIGISRPLSGDLLEAVRFVNGCKQELGKDMLVLSVDMPSGVCADDGRVLGDAVRADMTVTFNQVKLGQILYPGCDYVGKLVVSDAGITPESFMGKEPGAVFYDKDPKALLPERRHDGNKGTYGKVLIIAGSKEISGACILAASAALKAGAGMVRVFTASENAEAVKTLLPEAVLDIYEDFEPVEDRLKEAMEWSTQAVIGPGIGTFAKGKEILSYILCNYDKSLVMDADALNIISEDKELFSKTSEFCIRGKKLILTPHLGEFSRLMNKGIKECKDNLLTYPLELARKLHCTVLCKDARSIVADSNEKKIYINISGNDGMATAGSGDVLAGILGALLSCDMTGFEIAMAGAYIHGKAGDVATEKCGRYSLVASDIVASLPEVIY